MELTGKLKEEYLELWNSCVIKSRFEDDLDSKVKIIEANQSRYIKVSEQTGVPWYVIAIIHGMEAGFDFSTHLHNGDSLTDRTVLFPAGRPRQGNPPFTWEKSAIDALHFDGATEIKLWDLPTTFWFLEGYNGWGYRTGEGQATTPINRSPYIYSGTTHYEQGKYRADGIFDPSLVSAKVGCMAQLFGLVSKGLVDLDSSILQPANTDPMKVGSSSDLISYPLSIGLKHLIFAKIFFRSPLHLTSHKFSLLKKLGEFVKEINQIHLKYPTSLRPFMTFDFRKKS